MVKKTIAQLTDGEATRTSAAVVAFEEGGVTLKTSIRPNPLNTHYVRNQAQLEEALGSDLIIPAATSVAVIIDESFTLTKPFKKQAGSSLLLKSHSVTVTLTYTGTGALIQMDGAVIGTITQIENITLSGNFTNQCFAIEDSTFFIINLTVMTQFAYVGFLKGMQVLWEKSGLVTNLGGMAFIDCLSVSLTESGSNGVGVPPTTLFSFVTTIKMDLVFTSNVYTTDSTHEYIFLDPNSDITSSLKVRDSGIISTVPQSLFQKGVDEAVTAVADNGSGKIRCTSAGHAQIDNTYAVLSEFSESTYNKTALITVIDVNTFDVEEIDFVAGDSGNINRISLDAVDPRVIAKDNPQQPDSMSLAENRTSAPLSFLSVISTFVELQNTVPAPGDFIEDAATERFVVDDSTGIITYTGAEPITSTITFEFLLSKAGGGTDTGTIALFQNATQQTKTNQLVSITSTVQKVIYSGGIFDILPGDTFQLFLNSDSASTINISALKILITRQ